MIQLSVFIENEPGKLLKITQTLGQAGIDIQALTIAETKQFGVVRMVVDDTEIATAVLTQNGLVCHLTEVTAIEIEDRPGELAKILEILGANKINVEYMYGFFDPSRQKAIMIMRFKEDASALSVLMQNNINIFAPHL